MFFRFTNSPATFQTMINTIFREEVACRDLIIYIDDMLITTKGNFNQHYNTVAHTLKKLQEKNLFLKLEKCHFHKQEVEFLDVIIGKGQVKMEPSQG